MKDGILKENQSIRFHIISGILGVMFVGLGIVSYLYLYNQNIANITIEAVAYMAICIVAITFGFLLCVINFKDCWISKVLIAVSGFIVAGIFFNKQFRFGVLLLIGIVTVYFVTLRFKNVFSTIVTISVTSIIFLLLTYGIMKVGMIKNVNLLLYGMFSLFIVFYRVFGKKINQLFIAKMLGFEEESESFDYEQLMNQILLIYMITFVCLNILLYIENINGETWNLINNSFLTGLAIIQIDWNKILFCFRKTSNSEK